MASCEAVETRLTLSLKYEQELEWRGGGGGGVGWGADWGPLPPPAAKCGISKSK